MLIVEPSNRCSLGPNPMSFYSCLRTDVLFILVICVLNPIHAQCLFYSLCSSLLPCRSLTAGGELPCLQYLDLSGLCNVTERGLNDLVSVCPSLMPELLFYCDNIVKGPYADCANGCQNVGSPGLCCRRLI